MPLLSVPAMLLPCSQVFGMYIQKFAMLTGLLLALLSHYPTPTQSIKLLAHDEKEAKALYRICRRESRCRPIGPHEVDSHLSRRARIAGLRADWLRPWCPYHVSAQYNVSTRGPFGMMYAYHVRHLPISCVSPEVYDLPIVNTWIAAKKYRHTCTKGRCSSWCPGKCRKTQ